MENLVINMEDEALQFLQRHRESQTRHGVVVVATRARIGCVHHCVCAGVLRRLRLPVHGDVRAEAATLGEAAVATRKRSLTHGLYPRSGTGQACVGGARRRDGAGHV